MQAGVGMRSILQAQSNCPSTPQLAGISVGGWIVISLFSGIFVGILGTLLFQRWCTHSKTPPPAPSATYTPTSSLRVREGPSSLSAPSRPLPAAETFFSPLLTSSTQLPAGTLSAILSTTDVTKGVAPAAAAAADRGDTGTPIMQDQQAAALQMQPLGSWRQQAPAHETLTVLPDGQSAANSPVQRSTPRSLPAAPVAAQREPSGLQRPGSGGVQRPASLDTPSPLPAAARTQAANDSMPQLASPQRQQRQQQQPEQEQEEAWLQPVPTATPPVSPAKPAPAGSSPHVSGGALEMESEYEVDDLDADWRALLSGVDRRLASSGQPLLDARERAIAMRTLLAATHSRGADYAMQATVEEVVRFRAFHARRQQQ